MDRSSAQMTAAEFGDVIHVLDVLLLEEVSVLESGKVLRHTQQEVESFKELGIDLSEVRSEADLTRVLCEWVQIVSNERPAIIEKLAAALANREGLKLPPRLEVVRE
jgi:glycine cleavage system regulatory protein